MTTDWTEHSIKLVEDDVRDLIFATEKVVERIDALEVRLKQLEEEAAWRKHDTDPALAPEAR